MPSTSDPDRAAASSAEDELAGAASRRSGPKMREVLRAAWPALLVAVLVLAPFLDKPFTIDDLTFMVEAQHALEDPLHPSAVELVFHGQRNRISSGMVSGPVMAWLLLPAVALGGAEWAAHLAQLLLVGLGVLSTVALALRLGLSRRGAAWSGALLVTAPATIGMAATAMADVPSMAFAALAMERLVAFRAERRVGQGAGFAVALLLSVFSRPQPLLLVGVGAVMLAPPPGRAWIELVRRAARREAWLAVLRLAWPLLAPLPLVVLLDWITRDPFAAHTAAGTAVHRFKLDDLVSNAASFAGHWVLSAPLGLAWGTLRGGRPLRDPVVWAAAAAAAWIASLAPLSTWWLPAVCALGAATVADAIREAVRTGDRDGLALALWLCLPLPTLLYVHLPPKYLVPSMPAAAILVARLLDGAEPRAARRVPWLVGAAGVAVGVLVMLADWRMAEPGRRAARELVAPAVAQGRVVHCDGAWGFQWYCMSAGGAPLVEGEAPKPGELVLKGPQWGRMKPYRDRRLLHRTVDAAPGGRVLSFEAGAGFYSNGWGYLPWSWGTEELTRIELWEYF